MEKFIKGNYRKSIYSSDKGYVIGLFKVRETNDPELADYINKTITFTGYFYDLNEDDTYMFYGESVDHPRYGFQFQVSKYEKVRPTDRDGVIEFLSSDLFPGIGEKLAEKIAIVLGDDALERILNEPECLNLVPKLTQKKADKIYRILKKYEESHQIIVFLSELGFNMREALSIYNYYGAFTVDEVKDNIYKLVYDLNDISFPKIDSIALKMGIDSFSDIRLEAITYYVFNRITYQVGDTYLSIEKIKNGIFSLFRISISEDK